MNRLPFDLLKGHRRQECLPHRSAPAAFTLIELLVSLGITGLLMAGLGSAILLATRSVPTTTSPASQIGAATTGMDILTTDLYYARSFSSIQPTSLTFTVAPRGTDTAPETITYSWSGNKGDPLLRTYNASPAVPIVSNVYSMNFVYNKLARTSTQTVTTTNTSAEQLLASFTNWGGLLTLPASNDYPVSSTQQIAEYFQLNATAPAGAIAMNITRATLNLKAVAGGGSTFTVGLYKPATAPTPSTTLLAKPVTVSSSILGSSYAWTDIYFSNATITNLNQDFCLVVSAPTTAYGCCAQYLSVVLSLLAPVPVDAMQTNSGSGWGPTTNNGQQEVPFYFYGTWTTSTTSQQQVTDYYLQSVGIQMQLGHGATPSVPLNTTVEVYTVPKVTGL